MGPREEDLVRVQSEDELRPGMSIWGHCDCGTFHSFILTCRRTWSCPDSGTNPWATLGGCGEFSNEDVCCGCAIRTRGLYRLRDLDTPQETTRERERERVE